jgi:hypothetical protein
VVSIDIAYASPARLTEGSSIEEVTLSAGQGGSCVGKWQAAILKAEQNWPGFRVARHGG